MTLEIEINKLEQGLHDLFKYVFAANCELDEEGVTPEEEKTLEELDPLEVLENLKDVVIGLLKYKKSHKSSDLSDLISRSEQFESMIQKLEGDIRNHIKIEHQLKLHIEATQAKIDELEPALEKANSIIKKLEKKQEKNMHDIYNKSLEKSHKLDIKKKDDPKSMTCLEPDDNWEEMFHKLEREFLKIKALLEEKKKECEMLKNELSRTHEKIQGRVKRNEHQDMHNLDVLRKRLIEKGSELTKMQQKMKEKSYNKLLFIREKARNARRSLGEIDMIKNYNPNLIRKENTDPSPKKEDLKAIALKKARSSSRGHARSFSEQTRPKAVRRTPSR